MHWAGRVSLLVAVALAASLASANDGILEKAAGGLVFTHSDDIDMLSEDLFVSLDRIRVRYAFRNQTDRDVRVTVGFPLPDHDLRADFYGDTAYPTEFRTLVDGRPVATQVEYRALWQDVDHSDLLNRLGVPIMYAEGGDIAPIERALSALPAAERERLLALGLVEPLDENGDGRTLTPLWTVREIWHWEQVFPAGRDLRIEHSYRPGAGGTIGTGLAPGAVDEDVNRGMIERYCIDENFMAAFERVVRRSPDRLIAEHNVSYILTTGAGWRSPIGEFRLVVDKGRAENLVSFCEEGVRRIGPTRFEVRRRNWRPTRDLHVVILQPPQPD